MRIDVANVAWQLDGDADLVEYAAQGEVAAFVEARRKNDQPVDVGRILGPLWQTLQRLTSGDVAGSALAVRRSSSIKVARWKSWRASRASRAGGGVQDRYALAAVLVEKTPDVIYESHMIVVHPPLRGTGRQDDAIDTVRTLVGRAHARRGRVRRRRSPGRRRRIVRWAVMGDFNRPHEAMRTAIGGTGSVGAEVMGFVHGPGWGQPQLKVRHRSSSDHPILTILT